MTEEELARELWILVEGNRYFEFNGDSVTRKIYLRCAEYLLSNYHIIPKSVMCYEGIIDIGSLGERGYAFYFGERPEDWGGNKTLNARLFIEEEK